MSSLQDKINNARIKNHQTADDAIEEIEKQTQGLITDFDKLTIDKPTRESRRDAALKVLERVRNGEIDKVDEDEIRQTHNNLKNEETIELPSQSNSNTYKNANENEIEDADETKNNDENNYSHISKETSDALKKLQAMSVLLNDEDINKKIQEQKDATHQDNDSHNQFSESNKNVNDNNDKDNANDQILSDQSEKNNSDIDNQDEKKQDKKPGFFKKMINFFKGE